MYVLKKVATDVLNVYRFFAQTVLLTFCRGLLVSIVPYLGKI